MNAAWIPILDLAGKLIDIFQSAVLEGTDPNQILADYQAARDACDVALSALPAQLAANDASADTAAGKKP
jgi:hypothetical protein